MSIPRSTRGASRRLTALALPATDLTALKQRVTALAENRPGVYRMIDPLGRVVYVGKAKQVRTRLLSYFRAKYPEDKASRILYASATIEWDYVHSEFAAYLGELRQIARLRPALNYHMNRARRTVFIKVSAGPAPRISSGPATGSEDARWYGPFVSGARVDEGIRTLNDLLGLRDCAPKMPIVFAGQADLFDQVRRAACMRHDFGFCSGPCAGFVAEMDYRRKVETAIAFLEGRTIHPIDRIVLEMQRNAEETAFERATKWRERFEQLEWLLAATTRARSAVETLSFVYRDPGVFGDDRAYLIRRGVVRATYPFPTTPLEREAFCGVVRDELAKPAPEPGPLPYRHLDEILLVMAWFRKHPDAFRRTTSYEEWLN
ncbi:MAG: nuclease [Gemmatimonadota bacterium]